MIRDIEDTGAVVGYWNVTYYGERDPFNRRESPDA